MRYWLGQSDMVDRHSESWDAGREGGPPGEPRLGRSRARPQGTIVNAHLVFTPSCCDALLEYRYTQFFSFSSLCLCASVVNPNSSQGGCRR